MPRSFQPGDAVRLTGGAGSEMVVVGYDPSGQVRCSLWVGVHLETRPFAAEALEVIPDQSVSVIMRDLQRDLQQGKRSGGAEDKPTAHP
jgi:uncharacterized protein YodC (DUF2158 family)